MLLIRTMLCERARGRPEASEVNDKLQKLVSMIREQKGTQSM